MSFFHRLGKRLFETSGLPSNLRGHNGDYALGQDGVIYKKQAGTWGAYGGGGGGLLLGHLAFARFSGAVVIGDGNQHAIAFDSVTGLGGDFAWTVDDPANVYAQVPGIYSAFVSVELGGPDNLGTWVEIGLTHDADDPNPRLTVPLSSNSPHSPYSRSNTIVLPPVEIVEGNTPAQFAVRVARDGVSTTDVNMTIRRLS